MPHRLPVGIRRVWHATFVMSSSGTIGIACSALFKFIVTHNEHKPHPTATMSLDIFTLLTLPTSSKAFTAYKPTNPVQVPVPVPNSDDHWQLEESGSASPVRKVARLDSDSDSASASRSRPARGVGGAHEYGGGTRKRGVVKMKIVGPSCKLSSFVLVFVHFSPVC